MAERKIVFGSYDSWSAWGLTLTGYKLTDPEYKSNFVPVPGRDGDLDLSTALTDGEPRYNNRTLTATFELSSGTRETRLATFNTIVNALSGRRMNIVLPDDTTHYLDGRVSVAIDYCDPYHGALTVTANCAPWRLSKTLTSVTKTDLETAYKSLTLSNDRRPVVPEITIAGASDLASRGIISTTGANLRDAPSTSGTQVLVKMPKGAEVVITGGLTSGFYPVIYTPDGGAAVSGWTSKSNLYMVGMAYGAGLYLWPTSAHDTTKILTIPKGSTFSVTGAAAENGYLPVAYNGEAGWVNGNYVQLLASVSIKKGSAEFTLGNGVYELPDLLLPSGGASISYAGVGQLTVKYREGAL